ncbi:MAG: pentapeptide repeat-containing protein [Syntrophales bacterium]|nr:pentapeptide repeat-containing protein [Syntrophales bacterium]MCK9527850.1 pentapeptide repeat-containing protein [Syntrophales bacterium]
MPDGDLSNTDMSGANLAMAYLLRANMQNAILVGANMRGTDLTRADLRGADLSGIKRLGLWLRKTNLTGATWIDGSVCGENSISKCR